jgi:hypothetical protein
VCFVCLWVGAHKGVSERLERLVVAIVPWVHFHIHSGSPCSHCVTLHVSLLFSCGQCLRVPLAATTNDGGRPPSPLPVSLSVSLSSSLSPLSLYSLCSLSLLSLSLSLSVCLSLTSCVAAVVVVAAAAAAAATGGRPMEAYRVLVPVPTALAHGACDSAASDEPTSGSTASGGGRWVGFSASAPHHTALFEPSSSAHSSGAPLRHFEDTAGRGHAWMETASTIRVSSSVAKPDAAAAVAAAAAAAAAATATAAGSGPSPSAGDGVGGGASSGKPSDSSHAVVVAEVTPEALQRCQSLLRGMGFSDATLNEAALRANGGDMDAVRSFFGVLPLC